MKYIVVLGDGMSDEPIEALGGQTPLEYANTPAMDALASGGEMGMVQNVPAGMSPGSEIANLSVMGYDPLTDFTGRSPLEALSVGVEMEPDDLIFRCNVRTGYGKCKSEMLIFLQETEKVRNKRKGATSVINRFFSTVKLYSFIDELFILNCICRKGEIIR